LTRYGSEQDIKIGIYGIFTIVIAVVVYFLAVSFQGMRYGAIDAVNKMLFIPEYPFRAGRELIQYGSNWMLERETLQERISRVEAINRVQAEALQKAAITPIAPVNGYIAARVVVRYPEEWWREIKIDKGREDKVKIGAAVMSEGYLVGRVDRVGAHSAWVELITSSSFQLAVVIDETRDLGVITGDDKGNMKLLYIADDRQIIKNMNISTSLVGEQIPPGLMVGTIIGREAAKDGYVPLKVKAGAHLTQLYEVEVCTEAAK